MWKKLPNLVLNVVNHQAVSLDNTIYLFGGFKNSQFLQYEKISIYVISKNEYCSSLGDVKTCLWNCVNRKLESTETMEPLDRYGHTVVAWCNMAILFGGYSNTGYCQPYIYLFVPKRCYLSQLDICDTSSTETCWLRVDGVGGNAPCDRDGHSSTIYRNYMFVYGGLLGTRKRYYDNKLFQLDLSSWQWSKLYDGEFIEPVGRDFSTLLANNSSLYLFGGRSDDYVNDSSGHDIYDSSVWKFDLNCSRQARSWTKIHAGLGIVYSSKIVNGQDTGFHSNEQICPFPRRSHMAEIFQNSIIIFGGLFETKEFNIHFNDVWSFDLTSNSWTFLSKDSDIHNVNWPRPVRRSAFILLNQQCGLLTGGVSPNFEDPIEVDQIVSNVMHLSEPFKVGSERLTDNDFRISKLQIVSRKHVVIYSRSEPLLSGNIDHISNSPLKSSCEAYLFQPKLSLYQMALGEVERVYSVSDLYQRSIPLNILHDILSLKLLTERNVFS